jgi:integrase
MFATTSPSGAPRNAGYARRRERRSSCSPTPRRWPTRDAEASGKPSRREDKGSVGWLIERYYLSKPFSDLAEGTRARRRRMLEEFRAEHGTKRADGLPRRAVRAIMDKWGAAHGPHGANNRLKAIRGLYGWAADNEIVDRDATKEVDFFTRASSGFHTWSVAEIRKFIARWPLGTAPRLAMTVMLCTGTRISDAYKLSPENVIERRGERRIVFQPGKTEKTSGMRVDIPVLPMLAEALAAGPVGEGAFIGGHRGRPFRSPESLGTSFKRWCVEAGCLSVLGARSAQGRGDVPGRARGDVSAAHGDLRLDEAGDGRALHQAGRPGEDGRRAVGRLRVR